MEVPTKFQGLNPNTFHKRIAEPGPAAPTPGGQPDSIILYKIVIDGRLKLTMASIQRAAPLKIQKCSTSQNLNLGTLCIILVPPKWLKWSVLAILGVSKMALRVSQSKGLASHR